MGPFETRLELLGVKFFKKDCTAGGGDKDYSRQDVGHACGRLTAPFLLFFRNWEKFTPHVW